VRNFSLHNASHHRVIAINKSTYISIIISTLQIIHPNLGVIVIPSVAERIDPCNDTGLIGDNGTNTPSVVGISCYHVAVAVGDRNDVALQVLLEVVGKTAQIDAAYAVLVVVKGSEGIVIPNLAKDLRAVKGVFVLNTVYRLARADAVRIVGIAVAV